MQPYWQAGLVTLYAGDCRDILAQLPAESVQCCVTSPPYFGLRSYLPSEHPMKGNEIGLERTLDEYVAHIVEVMREVRRVLRPDGTLWLNLGDSYGSGEVGRHDKVAAGTFTNGVKWEGRERQQAARPPGTKPKDLMMVPARVAIALCDDGWWLRSKITWCKQAPMPESVTDRPTSATEDIYLLAKSPTYFYDAVAVREPMAEASAARYAYAFGGSKNESLKVTDKPTAVVGMREATAGRNLRNYLVLPPDPYPEAHFATFPSRIPELAILAGTSAKGACPACGAPWRRVVERRQEPKDRMSGRGWLANTEGKVLGRKTLPNCGLGRDYVLEADTLGWEPTCNCGCESVEPCVVLDPFAGSGTTGAVASRLGRRAVLIDLNPEYCKLAIERSRQQGMVLGV